MDAWKVLIADDEPKIRRGLRGAVESIGSDFMVVGEAEDGEMALALAIETRPDILLVDIRMPILNGLQLIERLAEISTDWIVIIVTGHDEFDYARQALKLSVTDYLLKPVSREAMITVLDAAKIELSSRRQKDHFLEWSRELLEQHLPYLREGFLRRVVAGSMAMAEIRESLDFLQLDVPEQLTMLTFHLVERNLGPGNGRESYRRLLLLTLKNLVVEIIDKTLGITRTGGGLGVWRHDKTRNSLPLVFEDESETIVALVPPWEPPMQQAFQAEFEHAASTELHHIPAISIGTVTGGLSELPDVYERLSGELLERGNSESFIQLIMNYLETHFPQPDLTLEEVAAAIQLSPGYLSRILKQKTGASFIDFVTRLRIKKASQLMSDPAAKMFEIAERVGYRSQHYFSRAFKKVLGVSPSDYRKGGAE